MTTAAGGTRGFSCMRGLHVRPSSRPQPAALDPEEKGQLVPVRFPVRYRHAQQAITMRLTTA